MALHILSHATQPPYSAKIYVAERKVLIYAGAANIVPQCLNLLFVLAAMTNRSLLFNRTLDTVLGTIIGLLYFVGLISMLNLYFVGLWESGVSDTEIIPWIGETGEERVINHIYVATVVIFSIFFWGIILLMTCYAGKNYQQWQADQERLNQEFAALKPLKYEASDKDMVPTSCALCLGQFQQQDNIVTLKCHPGHVFHRQCMKQQLEMKLQLDKTLKCRICTRPLEFKN